MRKCDTWVTILTTNAPEFFTPYKIGQKGGSTGRSFPFGDTLQIIGIAFTERLVSALTLYGGWIIVWCISNNKRGDYKGCNLVKIGSRVSTNIETIVMRKDAAPIIDDIHGTAQQHRAAVAAQSNMNQAVEDQLNREVRARRARVDAREMAQYDDGSLEIVVAGQTFRVTEGNSADTLTVDQNGKFIVPYRIFSEQDPRELNEVTIPAMLWELSMASHCPRLGQTSNSCLARRSPNGWRRTGMTPENHTNIWVVQSVSLMG